MEIDQNFWKSKKVFLTGHTGFKGSWLSLWLTSLGAEVYGYSLEPNTEPSLFNLLGLKDRIKHSTIGNILDFQKLKESLLACNPEIVIHMAAQPLVRESYINPIETYQVNVIGTANILEVVRVSNTRVFLNITTDKCYENKEWHWGYRENEPLGGYDPYSSSKACSELVTSAYRNSFFMKDGKIKDCGIATARAGNVIGGGDFAKDRLIPDCVRSAINKEIIKIRFPNAIRPWQHVLEPLSGYMLLVERLYETPNRYSEAWNFGPEDHEIKSVESIVSLFIKKWGNGLSYEVEQKEHPHEANFLKLDISKSRNELGWIPRWSLEMSLDKIVEWTKAFESKKNLYDVSIQQINSFQAH
ncbi:MAG: CDP-glucose 4,6-dehydratase [Leptospiraceae bacterium]|nr:CDP-glucose 4,6-dehydratase [Leptospiraceae bacterium]